ncbi:hypothetical protein ACFSCX_21055 [Bacillus salitolerans]|uniref:Uncharacterized protein n=1 Tax=Bacillus salitolerans TaxID=1437434 RepID=A0ABW4LVC8_9BACI
MNFIDPSRLVPAREASYGTYSQTYLNNAWERSRKNRNQSSQSTKVEDLTVPAGTAAATWLADRVTPSLDLRVNNSRTRIFHNFETNLTEAHGLTRLNDTRISKVGLATNLSKGFGFFWYWVNL